METRIKEFYTLCLGAMVTMLGIAACGGGDGPLFTTPDAETRDGGIGGFWVGHFVSDSERGQQAIVVGMTTEQGQAQLMFPLSAQMHGAGIVSTSPDNVSGDLSCFLGRAALFVGTEGQEPMALTGEIRPKDAWTGSYETADDSGFFNLDYSATYETPSSIAEVTGLYMFMSAGSGGATYSMTLEVDDTGTVFGQDTAGCVYSGSISVMNSLYNLYDAKLSVDLCGELDGQYFGLASMQPGNTAGKKSMMLATSNLQTAFSVWLN